VILTVGRRWCLPWGSFAGPAPAKGSVEKAILPWAAAIAQNVWLGQEIPKTPFSAV
jgi:hypothetical protein